MEIKLVQLVSIVKQAPKKRDLALQVCTVLKLNYKHQKDLVLQDISALQVQQLQNHLMEFKEIYARQDSIVLQEVYHQSVAQLELIIQIRIKLLPQSANHAPQVKLATRGGFLPFKGDVLQVFIVQILKTQMFNKHVQKVTFVLKEYKFIQNVLLATISHLNINRLALNAQLDSFAHRLTQQCL